MNSDNQKYSSFALCREMLETPRVMKNFRQENMAAIAEVLKDSSDLMFTGEGSSRIFPAKHSRAAALRKAGSGIIPHTEGSTQALEYNLSGYGVLGASNSGRTKELVRLFRALKKAGHKKLCAVTANPDTPLEETSEATLVLGCGPEDAVAATKSVVEQALAVQTLMSLLNGTDLPDINPGAEAVEATLNMPVPQQFSSAMASARSIFFAGRNDGVAEELTLKTNEIVRKQSDFLEGTYTAHGIEEIMVKEDVVILVNPFPEEEEKFRECLIDGVGLSVIAIASRDTMFPTLKVPHVPEWQEYIQLAAGWNLLVEAGLAAGVDLDKPQRARKVGNEIG
ncbi:MAG: sugar isomerase [Spirochaetales bacterium]|nr:MAG: sugar isomerase [Spirochaetales bacterium]